MYYGKYKRTERRNNSLGKLKLSFGPLQMVDDLPENYDLHKDAFRFIKDVPVDWDDTKIIEAWPGDYITIARKEKGTPNWFIGAISDENSRKAVIPLAFLDKGIKYLATIYHDAANASYKDNMESYAIDQYIVDSDTKLNIVLAPGGGAAVSIKPVQPGRVKMIKTYK